MVVAVGNRVLLYNASDGNLILSLRAHKDTVYCVDFDRTGQRFASGSADCSVIIWSEKVRLLARSPALLLSLAEPRFSNDAHLLIAALSFLLRPQGKPILKYSHADSIQRVVYNPTTDALASCTNSDFGLWSPEEKAVAKYKVQSKILSASWSNDGQFLALGMFSGQITIRDRKGNEKVRMPSLGLCVFLIS